jgi:sugar lactone lactonase YvrE
MAPTCIWPLAAKLGEGALWCDGAFWFTDIKLRKIHRLDPAGGDKQSWDAPGQIGFIAPLAGGGFIAGLQGSLQRFDPGTGTFSPIIAVEADRPGNRLNDGAVDAAGRLWFGSMEDAEENATGALYCFEKGRLRIADTGYLVTNGPTFSPDGRTLYHTDTLKKEIYAFDCAADGSLANKRLFVRIEDGAGYPDGPVMDAEGYLWTGLFGGWEVRRYSPAAKLVQSIRFPVSCITKIAFGGPDLTDVYATTAWKALDAAGRAKEPLAGGVFHFRSDVPGLPANRVLLA